jgi:hypothetical protein
VAVKSLLLVSYRSRPPLFLVYSVTLSLSIPLLGTAPRTKECTKVASGSLLQKKGSVVAKARADLLVSLALLY